MKPPEDPYCPVAGDGGRAAEAWNGGQKARVAIFSLTGCEGCSLAILELEDTLLQILDAVSIVNFREGMSERDWRIDIGFVDGAVSSPHDEEQIRAYRACCRTLVAIGACACLGGVNTLKHEHLSSEYRRYVYGDRATLFATTDARPISAVVKVDYELPGCPMVKEEFLRFLTCLITGRPFRLPEYPVCVECKRRGVLCLYERGEICLGPLTRAGCDAICPYYGAKCEACRGVLGDESIRAFGRNIREQYFVPIDDVLASLRKYGAYQEGDLP
jgi:coenzyme F420-reducing hydrogenase gamma subunit